VLLVDEQPRKLAAPSDLEAGMKPLLEERFSGDRLSGDWKIESSKAPATGLGVSGGALVIHAAANGAAFAEHPMPPGTALVSCEVDPRTDQGASWGPGLALIWPDGRTLRVNLRTEGRFGVDDGKRQLLEGFAEAGKASRLVIQLAEKEVVVQALQANGFWQELARLPRREFAGDPTAVRVGKMSPGAKNEDFSPPWPPGPVRHPASACHAPVDFVLPGVSGLLFGGNQLWKKLGSAD
jgi:hypothetical protein